MKNSIIKISLLVSVLGMAMNLGLSVIAPLMEIIKTNLNTSLIVTGVIFGIFAIVRGSISPIAGKMMQNFSIKKMMIIGFIIYTISSIMYIFSDTATLLLITRIVQGISAGISLPLILAYAGFLSEEYGSPIPTNLAVTGVQFGIAIGPFIGGFIYELFNYNAVFYIMGLMGIAGIIISFFIIPHTIEVNKNSISVLKGMNIQYPREKGFVLKFNVPCAAFIFQFAGIYMLSVIMTLIAIYVEKHKLPINTSQIGLIIFSLSALIAVTLIPVGSFVNKFTKPNFKSLYFIIIGGIVSVVPFYLFSECQTFISLFCLVMITGIGLSILYPTVNSLSIIIGKMEGIGLWWGLNTFVNSLGYFLGSVVTMVLATYFGASSAFTVSGIICSALIFMGSYKAYKRLIGLKC